MTLLITLLTGSRPHYLERTLKAMIEHQPEVWEDSKVLVLHNGGDPETREVLKAYWDHFDQVRTTSMLFPIGPATSLLMEYAQDYEAEYLLHLEDDWTAGPGDLPLGADLLDEGIFQVRLRKALERVLPKHMVTGKSITWRWSLTHACQVAYDAHYTLNPSLMRLQDIKVGFPARDERHAQAKFHAAGYRKVAQLVPGIFTHIGEQSLRKQRRGQ